MRIQLTKREEDAKIAAERRSRTVRLHNLPEGTQEGLLQQALEKIVPVKRLEVFGRSNEANAELNTQAVSLRFGFSQHRRLAPS